MPPRWTANETPNHFQRLAIEGLQAVLRRHGIAVPEFDRLNPKSAWFTATFAVGGDLFKLLVAHDDIQMYRGDQMFEVYGYGGKTTDEELVGMFTSRLDKMLTSGAWD